MQSQFMKRSPFVKFIKKIPPSGGSPAYKLTLPHQVVHSQLLHLVDETFELSPSAAAKQTWQGSIAPRRNKERSEYTLQGWKLFAEAHKIQAGDQVSFELVTSRRLVVQIIRAADEKGRKSSPKAMVQASPLKVPQLQACSPDRSLGELSPSEEALSCWALEPPLNCFFDGNSLDGLDVDWQVPDSSPTALKKVPQLETSCQQNSPSTPSQQANGDAESLIWAAEPASFELQGQSLASTTASCYSGAAASQAASELELTPKRSNLSLLDRPPLEGQSSFTEMLLSPCSAALKGVSHSSSSDFLDDLFQGGSSGMIPTAVVGPPPPKPSLKRKMTTDFDDQLGSLRQTIRRLRSDTKYFQAQAAGAQKEVRQLTQNLHSQQDQLERGARGALRAAIGLEKCVTTFVSAANPVSNGSIPAAAGAAKFDSEISNCLGHLKESLWELLVLSSQE